jgi:hypothetical protein
VLGEAEGEDLDLTGAIGRKVGVEVAEVLFLRLDRDDVLAEGLRQA